VKRIQATIIAGLLLLMLILPQLALAAGPEIFDVDVENITFTTATITWTTNTTSDSQVNYGTDRPKDGTWKSVHDPAVVTHHSILLQNLTPDETYYFEVESEDADGTTADNNGGEYYSFKTQAWYSISLNPISGSCGEEITVTATVATPGTYRVCWDSLTAAGVRATFTATTGSHTLTFNVPEAAKGSYTVYLADNAYAQKAYATFEVYPTVNVDPDEGVVGTAVTLSGCGFTASQDIKVTLFQDEVQKGEEKTDTADAKGTWGPISYTIPDTPGGSCLFKVEAKEGTGLWVNWVSKDFEVIPKITVEPTSGRVGQPIQISGSGFGSKEKDIEITLGEKLWWEITSAEEDGSWTVTVPVPAVRRGEYEIVASGRSTRARDVKGVEFIVDAGISVDKTLAYIGDTIAVEGGGFAPGETGVRVRFDGIDVSPGTIPVDSNGCWESSFTLPISTYGIHTVSASGDTTSTSATTSVNTQARIIEISPRRGAPGDLVSLTGDGFGGSKQLTVRIGGKPALDPMQTLPNGNVAVSFHVPKDSPEGTLQLDVTDGEATDSDDFTVTKKTLSTTPLPISPRGSTLRSGVVTFKWQGVSGDTGYTYTLEINTTAGSGNIWSKSGIGESSYTLTDTETVTETLPKGTYYWRVKIVDDYGNESAWSDSSKFTVSPIPIRVWVVVGVVVLVGLMVVAYRETKFKVTE